MTSEPEPLLPEQITAEEYTEQVYKWLCQAYHLQVFSLGEIFLSGELIIVTFRTSLYFGCRQTSFSTIDLLHMASSLNTMAGLGSGLVL